MTPTDSSVSVHSAWKTWLRSLSFSASERRLNIICMFLARNDFCAVEDMTGARHPSVWMGAGELLVGLIALCSCFAHRGLCPTGELEFIYSIIPKKRKVGEQALEVLDQPANKLRSVQHGGPRSAIEACGFDKMSRYEKAAWAEQARIQSVLGASAKSLPSIRAAFVVSLPLPVV